MVLRDGPFSTLDGLCTSTRCATTPARSSSARLYVQERSARPGAGPVFDHIARSFVDAFVSVPSRCAGRGRRERRSLIADAGRVDLGGPGARSRGAVRMDALTLPAGTTLVRRWRNGPAQDRRGRGHRRAGVAVSAGDVVRTRCCTTGTGSSCPGAVVDPKCAPAPGRAGVRRREGQVARRMSGGRDAPGPKAQCRQWPAVLRSHSTARRAPLR